VGSLQIAQFAHLITRRRHIMDIGFIGTGHMGNPIARHLLRAGHSLVSALAVVADEAVEPAKSEFRRVLAEEQFGVQLEDAFKVVVQRMENEDLDQVAQRRVLHPCVASNCCGCLAGLRACS